MASDGSADSNDVWISIICEQNASPPSPVNVISAVLSLLSPATSPSAPASSAPGPDSSGSAGASADAASPMSLCSDGSDPSDPSDAEPPPPPPQATGAPRKTAANRTSKALRNMAQIPLGLGRDAPSPREAIDNVTAATVPRGQFLDGRVNSGPSGLVGRDN